VEFSQLFVIVAFSRKTRLEVSHSDNTEEKLQQSHFIKLQVEVDLIRADENLGWWSLPGREQTFHHILHQKLPRML
jgi:hypothetical protein